MSVDVVPARMMEGLGMSGELTAPLTPRAGSDDAWAATMRYIVARKRAEEALGFLAESSKVLAASLDLKQNVGQVVDFAVPFLADWCQVEIIMPDGGWQTLATAYIDQMPPSLRGALGPALHPHAEEVTRTCLPQSKTAEIDISYPFGLCGILVVPLLARGHGLGVIALVATEAGRGRRYSASDMAVAEELARRIASAVEIARLTETIRQLQGT